MKCELREQRNYVILKVMLYIGIELPQSQSAVQSLTLTRAEVTVFKYQHLGQRHTAALTRCRGELRADQEHRTWGYPGTAPR
ncbi:hypothetical protein NQZ68_033665 [Dissostichus eleginoides]|nr:hypothetical protein NQZ68_033665 [Dissostichus eleginoides]